MFLAHHRLLALCLYVIGRQIGQLSVVFVLSLDVSGQEEDCKDA